MSTPRAAPRRSGPWVALIAFACCGGGACSLEYVPLGGAGTGECEGASFSAPSVVAEVSFTEFDDWTPAVSGDELILVFASWRDGGAGGSDLWISTRPSVDTPFSSPVPIRELNSAAFEGGPALSADGLLVCFESDRPGGKAEADLYIATRPDRSAPFGTPTMIAEVSSDDWDSDCDLDSTGRTIVFVSRPAADGGGRRDLWTASRSSTGSAFSAPVALSGVNTPHSELGPSLSGSGLELFFSSDRPGGLGGHDIYVARRETISAPFGQPSNLTRVNSENDDGNPDITHDGRRLYLNRNSRFLGGEPAADIWQADRSCGDR